MTVIDEALLGEFRGRRQCEWCGQAVRHAAHPHHLHARGMGGGSRLDIPENLLALCPTCHDLAHRGKIARADLLARVATRLGRTPQQVQQVVWDALAKKKN